MTREGSRVGFHILDTLFISIVSQSIGVIGRISIITALYGISVIIM